MAKKTKSKARLDKYYRFAKEQGYRSRASFKLIQLNNKYNFLSSSRILIDLCAAPGGWLQVAEKFMPMGTLKIGIDLDPIKKINGVKTFQEDITTQKCIDILKKELQGQKADVFLNDGAPNVGANWQKDAHNQSELVLSALRLSSMFLKEGGYFITKVFRSTDFNSLIWVFNKLFRKVEVTKPQASRFTSAEIFVVCMDYLAPTFIDEKIFDPKEIFADTEADHLALQRDGQIRSMEKLLQQRRSRGGYEDNAPMHLYKQVSVSHFLDVENPFPIFLEYNKMTASPQQRQKFGAYMKLPTDFENIAQDLKVLGRRDVSILLKWRGKVKQAIYKQNHLPRQRKERQINSDDELDRQILQEQRREHKLIRKEKDKADQLLLMSKGLIDGHVHDGEMMNQNLGDLLEGKDLEDLGYQSVSEQAQVVEQSKHIKYNGIDELEDNIEEMYEKRKLKIGVQQKRIKKTRSEKKTNKKDGGEIEVSQSRFKAKRMIADEEEMRILKKSKLLDRQLLEEDVNLIFKNPLADADEDIYFSSGDQEDAFEGVEVDPDERVPGEIDDDNAYKIAKPLTEMEKRRKKLNKKAKKQQKIVEKDKKQTVIEVVPSRTMEDYDIDSLAETLALAKKMLRTRNREKIIDASYSRYTFEDHELLPNWFTDDERKHNYKSMPITKQEYLKEKNRLMAINAKAPKKVLEAKFRKKMKLARKLKKTKQRAEKIMEQQGVGEYHKMREVNKVYAKQFREHKTQKKYIVSKNGRPSLGKDGRNVKHVDSRLKKDKRATKRIKKTRHVHRKDTRKARF